MTSLPGMRPDSGTVSADGTPSFSSILELYYLNWLRSILLFVHSSQKFNFRCRNACPMIPFRHYGSLLLISKSGGFEHRSPKIQTHDNIVLNSWWQRVFCLYANILSLPFSPYWAGVPFQITLQEWRPSKSGSCLMPLVQTKVIILRLVAWH